MPIERRRWIRRQMLRDEPDTLFVFGDNFQERGFGGQAREMRGEPNAVGIPTKKAPSNDPDAFLSNADLKIYREVAYYPLKRLLDHIRAGGKVVWPEHDIGTGLADLESRAPDIWEHLQLCKEYLFAAADVHERKWRQK